MNQWAAERNEEWHPDDPEPRLEWLLEECLRIEAQRPPDTEPPFNPYESDERLMLDLHWTDEPEHPVEDRYIVTVDAQMATQDRDRFTVETQRRDRDSVTVIDSTPLDMDALNPLDSEALDAVVRADRADITYHSLEAQRRIRGRLLPGLREVRDRLKAGLTIGGCTEWGTYLRSLLIQPATFRKWEQREREALRSGDPEEFETPPGKQQQPASPVQHNDRGYEAQVLAVAGEIIAAGFRAVAKKSHPDIGGDVEKMKIVNDAVQWLRKFLASDTEIEFAQTQNSGPTTIQ